MHFLQVFSSTFFSFFTFFCFCSIPIHFSCKSTTWVIGTVIFVSGSLLNFAAFAFAPQSILASLEGIQFVTNVAFGKCVMNKKISRSMYAGTVVTIFGVVLTVLSASVVGTLNATFKDLLALWADLGWLLYISFTIVLGIILQATHQVYIFIFNTTLPPPSFLAYFSFFPSFFFRSFHFFLLIPDIKHSFSPTI
jgi:hypothetical protein